MRDPNVTRCLQRPVADFRQDRLGTGAPPSCSFPRSSVCLCVPARGQVGTPSCPLQRTQLLGADRRWRLAYEALNRRWSVKIPPPSGQVCSHAGAWGASRKDHGRVPPDILECGSNLTPMLTGTYSARHKRGVGQVAQSCRRFGLDHASKVLRSGESAVAAARVEPKCSDSRPTPLVSPVTEVRCGHAALPAHSKAVRNP